MDNKSTSLFVSSASEANQSSRALQGTAQLTSSSARAAGIILQAIIADIETFAEDFENSKTNNDTMDSLIESIFPKTTLDITFLADCNEHDLIQMLKSQQSKRSRARGKGMTAENYKTILTAAVAENMLRLALGKPKSSAHFSTVMIDGSYSDETLDALAKDQEALRREIRNIQSKKSIAKSKEDFSEESAQWLNMLDQEARLKSVRVDTGRNPAVDRTKIALANKLEGLDISNLKSAEAKAILAELAALV